VIKTITADNGTGFHGDKEVEEQLGVQFYFATPYRSWERGTNENTNGLLRQYLPKGTSLKSLTQAECDRIAAKLNVETFSCPARKTLDCPCGDVHRV